MISLAFSASDGCLSACLTFIFIILHTVLYSMCYRSRTCSHYNVHFAKCTKKKIAEQQRMRCIEIWCSLKKDFTNHSIHMLETKTFNYTKKNDRR